MAFYHPTRMHGQASTISVLKTVLLLFALVVSNITTAQTVYVTRTGEKYHADACRYLSRSKIAVSLKDAVRNGYTPCSVCKPRTSETTQRQNITPQHTPTPASTTQPKATTSRQCSGITKSGARCKRMTTSASGRCYQH